MNQKHFRSRMWISPRIDIKWSRHITAHDRIIYNIYDEIIIVEVIQLEEHYNDK